MSVAYEGRVHVAQSQGLACTTSASCRGFLADISFLQGAGNGCMCRGSERPDHFLHPIEIPTKARRIDCMRTAILFSALLAISAFAGGEISLFNGKDLSGWTNAEGKPVTKGWKVEEGVLHRSSAGGDLLSEKEYGDFELIWEWKIAAVGNSGVKYRVQRYPGKGLLGFEYQMLDDEKYPDAKVGPIHQTGALYEFYPPVADKKLNPPGQWNTSRIVLRGTHVEHWLNGAKVVDAELAGDVFRAALGKSKFKGVPHFGEAAKGRILLQDHGTEVWFRKIVLKEL